MGNLMIMPAGRGKPSIAQVKISEYTGTYRVDVNGRVRFLTSGNLYLAEDAVIDVFAVGGGASGTPCGTDTMYNGGIGGSGGKTASAFAVNVYKNQAYHIEIGEGGDASDGGYEAGTASVAFGVIASGGTASSGGSGGGSYVPGMIGGIGGTDGGNGEGYYPGTGQGTTTRAFGEEDGELYADGGAGGTSDTLSDTPEFAQGGPAGGGSADPLGKMDGKANTGSGGGGASWYKTMVDQGNGIVMNEVVYSNPGSGGSGVVIIRKAVS